MPSQTFSPSPQVLQAAASTNGNGTVGDLTGMRAALLVIGNTTAGTGTITLQGSIDGTNWFVVGYQQIDNTAAPARAVAAISVAGNTQKAYQVLDLYPSMRAVLSGVTSSPAITVTVTSSH